MIDGGLCQSFQKHLPDFHIQRVETGGTGKGIPDMNYCHKDIDSLATYGIEGWVEAKITSTNAVGMRSEQVGWIERRCRAGGRVFIAVRFKHEGGLRKGAKIDAIYLYHGRDVRSLYDLGLAGAHPVVTGPGGPARWPWEKIRLALLQNHFLFP